MYAVIRTGGKQYRVSPGDILEVERLAGEVGDSVVLDDVLLVAGEDGVEIGQPNVAGASVTARITGQHRGEKILVFRYRPKKRVRVRRGHRQYLTRLQVHKISGDGYEYVEEGMEEASPDEIVEEAVAAVAVTETAVAAGTESEETSAEETSAEETEAEETEAEETESVEIEEDADIGDKAVAAVRDTVARASDAVEAAGDAAEDAVEAVGDAASDAIEAVGDVAEGAVEAVSEAAEDAVEAVSDLASDAADAVDAVADKAGDAVESVAENLKGLVGRGKRDSDEAKGS